MTGAQPYRESFADGYRRALADGQLQRALATGTGKALRARQSAVDDVGPQWELLRRRAREIKEHAINHLDYYLEEFARSVERAGGQVYWAKDAQDANRYITGLARVRGISLVVKGKSMMTEEIELNRALMAAGLEVVETDLGEYIVQLAGERPSHINMPAIHKTRVEIADLLADKLRVKRPEDIEQITALARRTLRQKFAQANIGITGVNFAVAETGTIVLVENEGNIRLSTSLPRLHVALLGIEKVIPRLEDVEIFLRLLSRSASGQKLTSYVSFLTGAKGLPQEEGPEELHVVLLDNGRSRILANPLLRQSLYCIRCGACLNTCPVYQKIGGHAYGWTYPGPIGAVLTPQLEGRARGAELPFASSLCGACREICPLNIDIPQMLTHLRSEIKEPVAAVEQQRAQSLEEHSEGQARVGLLDFRASAAAFAERLAFKLWAYLMKDGARYRTTMKMARLVQRVSGMGNSQSQRAFLLRRWTSTRDLPSPAPKTFRELWPEMSRDAEPVPGPAVRVTELKEEAHD
jgi:L-lactate dehydrogenase complex protein LldF